MAFLYFSFSDINYVKITVKIKYASWCYKIDDKILHCHAIRQRIYVNNVLDLLY